MSSEYKDINEILKALGRSVHIKPESIPNMTMYMDQLTGFMEERLSDNRRYPEDKIMTKTMINNYVKNGLIPPPDKKKYSRDHILLLNFIYYFKNFMTMNDIDHLLSPLGEHYFNLPKDSELTLSDIYNTVFSLKDEQIEGVSQDICRMFSISEESFSSVKGNEGEKLKRFAFICTLCFDIYIRNLILEQLLDDLEH